MVPASPAGTSWFMEHRNPKRLTLRNDSVRPLSEEQIVDATRMFANGTKLVIKGLAPAGVTGRDIYNKYLQLKQEENFVDLDSDALGSQESESASWQANVPHERQLSADQFFSLLRNQIRATISLSLRDPVAAAKMVLEGNLIEGITYNCPDIRYTYGRSPRGLDLSTQFLLTGVADLVMFGLILLLDEKRGFKQKLCECQWGPCGILFFEVKPPTGRPQRKYCGETHMQKAHDGNAAKRMKKYRALQ
jgi:hypothetical protein